MRFWPAIAVTQNVPKFLKRAAKRAAKRPAWPPKSLPRIVMKRRATDKSKITLINPTNGLDMLAVTALQGAREEA